jgi:uncharacterized protein YjiS (DUF1127 family)
MSHFDIEKARAEIRNLIHNYPELEHDDVLRADMLEGETSLNDVIDLLLRKIKEAQTLSNAVTDEMGMLAERQTRFELRALNLRKAIFHMLEDAGLKKLERPRGTVSIASGRPRVIITDENALPEDFVRTKREPDKRRIETYLKAGETVPGATFSNAEPYLRIG